MLIMQDPPPPHNRHTALLCHNIGSGVNAALILISVSPFQDRNALRWSQLHLLTINEKMNDEVVGSLD